MIAQLLSALLAAVTPTGSNPPEPIVLPEEQPFLTELQQAQGLTPEGKLEALSRVLAKMLRPTPFRANVVCMRAAFLGRLQRDEFKAASEECYRLQPTNPLALGMFSAAHVYDADPVPTAKAYLASFRSAPELVDGFSPDMVQTLLDRLNERGQLALSSELLRELTRAGYGQANPAWASNAALRNIDALVFAGDLARARALLPNVINPADAKALLIDKSFAPLAGDLKLWAADGLVSQRDAFIAATRGAFDIDPSHANRIAYANALQQAGRYLDAANLLKAGLIDRSTWDEDRYEVVDTAVRLASSLVGDGRPDEAIAELEKLHKELSAGEPTRSTINIVPNLARVYIGAGRYQDALALLDRTGLTSDRFEVRAQSGYADALRGCALAGLGRASEAAVMRKRLDDDQESTRAARQMLIGCLGDAVAAEAEVLAVLDDLGARRAMLVKLRELEVRPEPNRHSFGALARQLLARPAIRARLDALSSPVADAYKAAFAGWQAPDQLAKADAAR